MRSKKKKEKSELSQSEIKAAIRESYREVSNWGEFHSLLEKTRDSGWLFRGVTSLSHYPIPSIGREKIHGHYKQAQEIRLFQEFKNRAVALVSDSRFDDWDWLAYAQHIGVPTRLLDWSVSPLIATFFALETDVTEDRLVYAVKYSKYIHEVERRGGNPFENKVVGRFSPPLAFDRIRMQRGVFTIHPDPTKIFYFKSMKCILIKSSLVPAFRHRLFKYGIDHWHIYPDMHGLGKQMAWQYKNRVGLGNIFMDNH